MINYNETIAYMIKQGELTKPPDGVTFRNYDIMKETALQRDWYFPTRIRCQEVWDSIKDGIRADQVIEAEKTTENNEILSNKMLLKVVFYLLKYIKGDITKLELSQKPVVIKLYKVCNRLFT